MSRRRYVIHFPIMFFLSGCIFTATLQSQIKDLARAPSEALGFSGAGLHLYPLGWSSEGRWGALIGRDSSVENPGIRILVLDAVTDENLHYSDNYDWSGPDSFNAFWDRYAEQVMEVEASFHLESASKPDVRDARFTTGGYHYEFMMHPPSPATGAYTLKIRSSRGDVKNVYRSRDVSQPDTSVFLGAMVSPFEERALAIIREDGAYRFSGAHLTLGFVHQQSSGAGSGKLLSAVFNGQEYLVRSRLSAGADPDEKDARGYSAVLIAARLRLWGIVDDLLAAGASPHIKDRDGRTALFYAAFAGEAQTVQKLLEAGAEKTIRDRAGRTPADLAAEETVRFLLE